MKWTNEKDDFLRKMWDSMSDEELCKELGTTTGSVQGRRRRLGLKRKEIQSVNNIKYSYEEVKEMFEKRNYTLISKAYINKTTKLEYICNKHKDNGIQKIDLSHFLHDRGCYYCGRERTQKGHNLPEEFFVKLCEEKNFEYVCKYAKEGFTYVDYICNKHRDKGIQSKLGMNLKSHGCIYCDGTPQKSHEDFVKQMNEINPNINIVGEYISQNKKVECSCKIHGGSFFMLPSNMYRGATGCKMCSNNKTEKEIYCLLKSWGFSEIKTQKTFKDCKDKKPLPFDFYLEHYNIIIEYDGQQHYSPVAFGGKKHIIQAKKDFIRNQEHDLIKTEYCKTHKIKLIRIPYWEKDDDNLEYFLYDQLVKYKAIQTVA